jgi:hypothetical protein
VRSAIAKKAAISRWEGGVPQAICGSPDHPLKIGEIEIPCYVLETGHRVISQRGMQSGIGMYESGGAQRILAILTAFTSKGVDCKDLPSRIMQPIVFRTSQGVKTHGYEATILADLCDVFLMARKIGAWQILLNLCHHFMAFPKKIDLNRASNG